MARQLMTNEINALASGKGVRQIAVENFLSTINTELALWQHMANLDMDARLYKWNGATVRAITKGLKMAYKGEKGLRGMTHD
jgi:hypothetical protein